MRTFRLSHLHSRPRRRHHRPGERRRAIPPRRRPAVPDNQPADCARLLRACRRHQLLRRRRRRTAGGRFIWISATHCQPRPSAVRSRISGRCRSGVRRRTCLAASCRLVPSITWRRVGTSAPPGSSPLPPDRALRAGELKIIASNPLVHRSRPERKLADASDFRAAPRCLHSRRSVCLSPQSR